MEQTATSLWKKVVCWALVICLVVTLTPQLAFAQPDGETKPIAAEDWTRTFRSNMVKIRDYVKDKVVTL